MDARPDLQFYPACGQIISYCTRVRDGSGKTVQLRHDQCVARTHGSQRLIEAGPRSVCTGEAPIRVDAIRPDTELEQGLLLCGEILLVG